MQKYKRVYLEISNICNLSCSFCPIDQRQQETMSLDHFQKIIHQVKPLTEQICLHLMGEPLAHPNFKEVLEICSENNCKIQLTTNGILLKKWSELILSHQSVVQVNISLQSYMDNFPNKEITPYLEGLYSFVESTRELRPELYINLRLWNVANEVESDHAHVNDCLLYTSPSPRD